MANGSALMNASRKRGSSGIRIKPSQKGSLHRALGIPEGQKIPPSRIAAAKNSPDPAIRKKATFAQNAAGWRH